MTETIKYLVLPLNDHYFKKVRTNINTSKLSIFKMVQTSTYVKRTVYAEMKTVSERVCHLFSTTTVLYLITNFTNSFD